MNRRTRLILGCCGILVGVAGFIGVVADRREAARKQAFFSEQAARFRESERARGTFRAGDRVRIAKWAGTIKPAESGAPTEIDADRGRTGVFIGEERQIATVRWSPQKWKVNGRDQWIDLPAFEATIHVSYLEVIP